MVFCRWHLARHICDCLFRMSPIHPTKNKKTFLVAYLLFLVTPVLNACPVCFSGSENSRDAFLYTTILMTLLPLFIVGIVAFVIRKKFRQLQHREP